MSEETLQINCSVRAVLARHWIDQSRLSYHVRRGHVHLGGELHVLGTAEARGDTAIALQALEAEIRRLRDVKSVHFDLTNWIRDEAGNWSCVTKEFLAPPSKGATTGGQGEVVEL